MRFRLIWTGLTATLLVACASTPPSPATQAQAQLEPIGSHGAIGSVLIRQHADGQVSLQALVRGLTPNTEHGFHIHEHGSCQDQGNAAGGHFNPMRSQHGKYSTPQHHVGDLPSLKADANGVATLNLRSTDISLADATKSVMGRAIVVHAKADDYVSQPSGDSGARIACGVISLR